MWTILNRENLHFVDQSVSIVVDEKFLHPSETNLRSDIHSSMLN